MFIKTVDWEIKHISSSKRAGARWKPGSEAVCKWTHEGPVKTKVSIPGRSVSVKRQEM